MKLLTKFFLLMLCVVSVNAFALSFKEPGVLAVCSYSEFKPISYGNGQGYEADLLKAIAASWQVKIKFYPESFYEGLWRLPSRDYTRCDVAIGGFTPADYRIKEGTVFTIITTHFDQSLLVRKSDYESGKITSYKSFKNTNLKIGVVPGTTGESYAHLRAQENQIPLDVFIEYKSEAELLPALLAKKIDAIARGEIGNEYQASLNDNLITIAKKNFHEGFAFSVDSSNPELLKALNEGIRKVTDDGKITYRQWLANPGVFKVRN